MHLDTVHHYAPGKVGRRPVGLLVYKISPPADGLSQYNSRRGQVSQRPEVYSFNPGKYYRRNHRRYKGAVDGKTTSPYVQYLQRVLGIVVPVEQNIINPCPND